MQDIIVVTGAAGNVGKALSEKLLSRGALVRAVGRDAGRLAPLVAKGAEPFVGSVDDASAMRRAFEGAAALFAIIPPSYDAADFRAQQRAVVESYGSAIAASAVKSVVALSSVGGQHAKGTGPIAGLHEMEERFARLSGVHVLILRPAFFMENFYWGIGMIKQSGIYGSPIRPDLKVSMIATRDIAEVAARALVARDFRGTTTRELLGAADLTMPEATRVLGGAIGRPDLPYVPFGYDDTEKALTGMGFSASAATTMVEMYRGFNEGLVRGIEPRSGENTTPTTLEEFAKSFAAAYGA